MTLDEILEEMNKTLLRTELLEKQRLINSLHRKYKRELKGEIQVISNLPAEIKRIETKIKIIKDKLENIKEQERIKFINFGNSKIIMGYFKEK